MYRVSRLPRKVVISTDEVIRMGPVAGNPDVDNLQDAIIIAEERFLKRVMCPDFYYAFRDAKNVEVTEVNKSMLEELVNEGNDGEAIVLEVGEIVNAIELVENANWREWWNEFGWKITAEAVVYIATPTNWIKAQASGEMVNNPKTIAMGGEGSGASSVELKDVKWKMDKMLMDRLDPLIEASHEWMSARRGDFPLYNCKSFSSDEGVSYKRKTGFIHGIYDKKRKRCGCNSGCNCND